MKCRETTNGISSYIIMMPAAPPNLTDRLKKFLRSSKALVQDAVRCLSMFFHLDASVATELDGALEEVLNIALALRDRQRVHLRPEYQKRRRETSAVRRAW